MVSFPSNETMQIVGSGIVAFCVLVGAIRGALGVDRKPPPDRAPSTHELREALREVKELLVLFHQAFEQGQDWNRDRYNELSRQLDRIEYRFSPSDTRHEHKRNGHD